MCLILFAINQHPKYKLIFAANRDEFFNRPTRPADVWNTSPWTIGGLDKKSGGTWLGMGANGKLAAVTNYRDPKNMMQDAPSRGGLTKNFLLGQQNAKDYLQSLAASGKQYNGFNLLLRDETGSFFHYSNISRETTRLDDGIHGLSNHLLDTPWPKVKNGQENLIQLIESKIVDTSHLMQLLRNDQEASQDQLPQTGIAPELERQLSPMFIRIGEYGTRCSTVILIDKHNQVQFTETSFNERTEVTAKRYFGFRIKIV